MKRKSGLADSPFFNVFNADETTPVDNASISQESIEVKSIQPEIKTQSPTSKVAEVFHSSTLPIQQSSNPEWQISAILPNSVCGVLKMKNDKKTGFRLPGELVSELEDIPYQVKKDYNKRVDKTDILVAALAFYIHEFHQKGKDSFLYRHLIEGLE